MTHLLQKAEARRARLRAKVEVRQAGNRIECDIPREDRVSHFVRIGKIAVRTTPKDKTVRGVDTARTPVRAAIRAVRARQQ